MKIEHRKTLDNQNAEYICQNREKQEILRKFPIPQTKLYISGALL
jgi:hypothetical protein